jgi:hypothetical protein
MPADIQPFIFHFVELRFDKSHMFFMRAYQIGEETFGVTQRCRQPDKWGRLRASCIQRRSR